MIESRTKSVGHSLKGSAYAPVYRRAARCRLIFSFYEQYYSLTSSAKNVDFMNGASELWIVTEIVK